MVKKLLLIVVALVVAVLPAASQDIRGEHLTLLSLVARSSETECLWINSSTGVVVKGACPVGDITDVSFTLPSALFTTPPTGSPCTTGNCAFTFALASQSANTIFARSTGSGTPTFQSMTKAMTPATTVHTDQTNTFGAFLQTFGGGLTVSSGTLTSTGTTDLKGDVLDSTGNLTINDSADFADNVTFGTASGEYLGRSDWASRTTGWRGTWDGIWDVRYLYADEIHVKAFIADLEQALAGIQLIAKSVAKLATAFTAPANTTPVDTLIVEEFAGFTGQVFVDGDTVALRSFTRSGTGGTTLTVGFVVGTVTYLSRDATGPVPIQTYRFTRASAPSSGAVGGNTAGGTVIPIGTLVVDFGTTGSGYWETVATDGTWNGSSTDHAAGYGPYSQAVTWTTSPMTGRVIKARFGNLSGAFGYSSTSCTGSVPCWGMAAGDYANSESITVDQTNGVRFINDSVVQGSLSGTTWTLGEVTAGKPNVQITSSAVNLRNNTTNVISLNGTTGTITGATVQTIASCGTAASGCAMMDGSSFRWYNSTPALMGQIDGNGIEIRPSTAFADSRAYKFSAVNGGVAFGMYGLDSTTAQYLSIGAAPSTANHKSQVVITATNTFGGADPNDTTLVLNQDPANSSNSWARLSATGPILFYAQGVDGYGNPQLSINSSGIIGSAGTNVNLDSGTFFVDASNNYVGVNDATPSHPFDVNGTIYGQTNIYATTGFYSQGTAGAAGTASSGYWFGGSGVAHGNITYKPNEREFRFGTGNNPTDMTDPYGAAKIVIAGNIFAAGLYVNAWATPSVATKTLCTDASAPSGGYLYICYNNVSSRRFKRDIVPASQPWNRVLDIDPVWFYYSTDPDPNAPRQFGAIAEQLDDLGLTSLVGYDAQGRPESIHYDKIVLALIPVVRTQQEDIEKLKKAIADLQSLIERR